MKKEINTRFLSIGVQYFIIARNAVFCGFNPVSGNLYHLAIEMLLKSALFKKYTEDELYKKFHHHIPKMWIKFKSLCKNGSLNKFDEIINNLHKWESLRYLKFPEDKSVLSMTVDFDNKIKVDPEILKLHNQVHFSFNFHEMDKLFKTIILAIPLNPGFVKSYIIKKEALSIYKRDNKYSLW